LIIFWYSCKKTTLQKIFIALSNSYQKIFFTFCLKEYSEIYFILKSHVPWKLCQEGIKEVPFTQECAGILVVIVGHSEIIRWHFPHLPDMLGHLVEFSETDPFISLSFFWENIYYFVKNDVLTCFSHVLKFYPKAFPSWRREVFASTSFYFTKEANIRAYK
jgi:hypothetical protein